MNSIRWHISLCVLVIIWIIAGSISAIPIEAPDPTVITTEDANTILTLPVTITRPGNYVIDADYSELNSTTAILIASDDVTINGYGHTITGKNPDTQTGYGIKISDESRLTNISISNLTINGFETALSGSDISQGTLDRVSITNSSYAGLNITNCSDLTISNVEITSTIPAAGDGGGQGVIIADSDMISIGKSIIMGNGEGDDGFGVMIIRSTQVTLEDNSISGNAASGITTRGSCSGLMIQRNAIHSNKGNGISLGSGCIGPIVSENSLMKNVMTGIEISSSSQGILSGNSIDGGRIGLTLSESEGFSLSGNQIRDCTIAFDCTGSSPASFSHTIDTSNLADGRPIWFIRDVHNASIGSTQNPACIYAVNCSNLNISDLVFSKTGAGVFLVNSDTITISRIAALDNAIGIRIGYGSDSVSITDSNAEKNLIAGYSVSSSDNITFTSCSAQNNLAGFAVTGSTNVTFTNCHADQQTGILRRGPSGFQISGSSGISIINSSAEKNQLDGIYLKGSPETQVIGTSLRTNNIAGIAILSDRALLQDNKVVENKGGGILVYGNASSLISNRVTNNKGRGLLIDDSVDSYIWNNYFNNSKNIEFVGINPETRLNATMRNETAITGMSPAGGNYWGAPDKTGFSDTCAPGSDGFCSESYTPPGSPVADIYPLINPGSYSYNRTEQNMSIHSSHLPYDINHNGRTELQDVVCLMDLITSEGDTGVAYDYSSDGRVNIQDVVVLYSIIQNLS